MKITLLSNCDKCRAALKWIKEQGIDAAVIDIRKDGIEESDLKRWMTELGWEVLLNRRSTTWRGLSDAAKADPDNEKAIALIMAHPTLMKRPVIESNNGLTVGFDKAVMDQHQV
ncbi:MAG: Spx/MgsR family RNA polymerase-binding regulatory protein [Pseudomonadota bacterium]